MKRSTNCSTRRRRSGMQPAKRQSASRFTSSAAESSRCGLGASTGGTERERLEAIAREERERAIEAAGAPASSDITDEPIRVDRPRAIPPQSLATAVSELEASAVTEGPEEEVHLRVAGHGGKIFIDLVNDAWQAVEISPQGWKIVPSAELPIRFVRSNMMRPLPHATRGGSLDELRRLLTLGNDHPATKDAWSLMLSWLVQALRPNGGQYPVLVLLGGHGEEHRSGDAAGACRPCGRPPRAHRKQRERGLHRVRGIVGLCAGQHLQFAVLAFGHDLPAGDRRGVQDAHPLHQPRPAGLQGPAPDNTERLGYQVETQVGSAGFFIDLAIVDPERPGRYLLGIECDGATYHSARSARDRDRLRQEVLESLGWRIHRVWSTDWFSNPEGELKRLVGSIEEAKLYGGPPQGNGQSGRARTTDIARDEDPAP